MRRTQNYRWTRKDNSVMEEMLEAGHGYVAIGQRLGRTTDAVRHHAKRRGWSLYRVPGHRSASSIAQLVGHSTDVVTFWIRLGWLEATCATTPTQHPYWRVTDEALDAFLSNPAYMMAWDPARITDPELRVWAQQEQAKHPQWLHTKAVAARHHVTSAHVVYWICSGRLAGARYGRRYFVRECDLHGFVAPSVRRAA